jgi:hypothetical protein
MTGRFGGGAGFVLLLAGAAHAQLVDTPGDIPGGAPDNASRTENVDFGDVDGDGDWDAVFADGADFDQDQNRLWINQGPGSGLGVFVDETATRCPPINDQSRDVEFVDFDGDSDLDLYVANHSSIVEQPCRWWHNMGVQSGTYADETQSRWIGLGEPGSSVPPGLVLSGGGFVDWCGDGDFADLDADGDLDLVHSSYGPVFSGRNPTRLFLNDGAGHFREFNPSGHQLPGSILHEGAPGLWCEGTQMADTTDASGHHCDISSSALDVDAGDVDGDFDLDLLHGARQELPRLFTNRLEENGGLLSFRDTTGAAFPPGYSTGDGHYEQEMGDLDGDGDLDIYGLNWQVNGFNFDDVTLEGRGDGTFTDTTTLAGSGSDDNEADLFDYDSDGDLDVYVANFSGEDRVYRNDTLPGAGLVLVDVSATQLPGGLQFTTLDADACDVDGDGDYDVFVANDNNSRNLYLQNRNDVPDSTAPYLPRIEAVPDRAAGSEPTVVRVHVYDNAPYYVTWYASVELRYRVDDGPILSVPMQSSGGQVFRGELDGSLVGSICYAARATDEHGNVGDSGFHCFVATPAGPSPFESFCSGDGSGAACPCANPGDPGHGCRNGSWANGARLAASGDPIVGADTLVLSVTRAVPHQPGLYFQGQHPVNGGAGLPFGDGLRCVGTSVLRLEFTAADFLGSTTTTVPLSTTGGVAPGDTVYYQLWYRDPAASPCGERFNTTQGLRVDWS